MRLRQMWYVITFRVWQVLMVVVKMSAGLGYQEMIEAMDKELTKVIEDFERAVNVEALRLAKETGKRSSSQNINGDSQISVASCRARNFAWATQICRGRL